jgi:hypothetical protein
LDAIASLAIAVDQSAIALCCWLQLPFFASWAQLLEPAGHLRLSVFVSLTIRYCA